MTKFDGYFLDTRLFALHNKYHFMQMLIQTVLFLLWGFFSSQADTLSKRILAVYPFPLTLSLVQFAISGVLGFLFLKLLVSRTSSAGTARPMLASLPRTPLLLVCSAQAIGFVLTNYSQWKGGVSFVQALKASSPLFNLVISMAVFGQRFSTLTYVSLAPIILGVAMTAVTELAFDLGSFASALVSNLCFESRALVTKRSLPNSVHVVQLYVYLSFGALLLTLPVWAATEAPEAWAALAARPSSTLSLQQLAWLLAVNGVFHYMYNQVSFTFLSFVAPLTHAICNVLRRIFVVLYAMLYFGEIPPAQNLAGIATVFLGVVLYLRSSSSTNSSSSSSSRSRASDGAGVGVGVGGANGSRAPLAETGSEPSAAARAKSS